MAVPPRSEGCGEEETSGAAPAEAGGPEDAEKLHQNGVGVPPGVAAGVVMNEDPSSAEIAAGRAGGGL